MNSGNRVVTFPAMPCKPVYTDVEDGTPYCKQHDLGVCPSCSRHIDPDTRNAGPGEPMSCPVHGVVARMGYP